MNDAATSIISVSGTYDQDVQIEPALLHSRASAFVQPVMIDAGITVGALSGSGYCSSSVCAHSHAQVDFCDAADAFTCVSSAECFSDVCSVAYRDVYVNDAVISITSTFGTDGKAGPCSEPALKYCSASAHDAALTQTSISYMSWHLTGTPKVAKSLTDDVAIKSTNFLEPMRIGAASKQNTRHVQTMFVNNTTMPIISVYCVDDEAGLCITPALKHCAAGAHVADDEA